MSGQLRKAEEYLPLIIRYRDGAPVRLGDVAKVTDSVEDRHSSAIEIATVDELAARHLAAPHIVQNVLAAAALSRACGIEPGQVHMANFVKAVRDKLSPRR